MCNSGKYGSSPEKITVADPSKTDQTHILSGTGGQRNGMNKRRQKLKMCSVNGFFAHNFII